MIIFFVVISFLLMSLGSSWIDYLYKTPLAPLSFPDEIESRSRFRKIFLMIAIFICLSRLAEMPVLQMIYATIAAFFLLLITITDFEQYVIFDKMIVPFIVIGLLSIFQLHLSIINHLIAAFVGGFIFFVLAMISNGALGGGDIKLIFVLGLWFGTSKLFSIVTTGAILGGIAALIMIITSQKDRQDVFAYGPYFCLSAIYFLLK